MQDDLRLWPLLEHVAVTSSHEHTSFLAEVPVQSFLLFASEHLKTSQNPSGHLEPMAVLKSSQFWAT
jgi:hypothetical protein